MDTKVEMAVRLAVAGMDVRCAWIEAGKPGGEAGLQNIRKHKRKQLAAVDMDGGCEPLWHGCSDGSWARATRPDAPCCTLSNLGLCLACLLLLYCRCTTDDLI